VNGIGLVIGIVLTAAVLLVLFHHLRALVLGGVRRWRLRKQQDGLTHLTDATAEASAWALIEAKAQTKLSQGAWEGVAELKQVVHLGRGLRRESLEALVCYACKKKLKDRHSLEAIGLVYSATIAPSA
jgi:hypothetical protein